MVPISKQRHRGFRKGPKRAPKITTCKSWGYEDRLRYSGLMSLKSRRKRGDMIAVFKFIKGIHKIDKNIFFSLADNYRVRGHKYRIQKSHSKLDSRKYYFSNRVIKRWESLDENVAAAKTVNCFKARLDKFIKNNINCEES